MLTATPTPSPLSSQRLIGDLWLSMEPVVERMEMRLKQQITAFEPEVQPLVAYTFQHSGKKLRPLLVFLMGMESEGEVSDGLIDAAVIVELVHLATLVHDDILDQADMRHRTETLVARHGAHTAVLLGDALFAHALHLAAGFPTTEVCRAVALATKQVCSGEIAQTFARGNVIPLPADYLRIIDLKTAELFRVSAYLGAFLAGNPPPVADAAAEFARQLGIAYQIFDDAVDFFAREDRAGKTLGTDFSTGKITLPVIKWLDSLEPVRRKRESAQLLNGNGSLAHLREALQHPDIVSAVHHEFVQHVNMALGCVPDIPGKWRQQRLLMLAEFVQSNWNKLDL